jgi:hypothetical protein
VGVPLNRFCVFPAFFCARPYMRSFHCVLCVAHHFWSGSPLGRFSVRVALMGAVQCEKRCKKVRKCLKVTLS